MSQDTSVQQPPAKAITWRGVVVGAVMVLLWTVACCFISVCQPCQSTQILMIIGFGGIVSVFLLRHTLLFLASVIIVYAGLWIGLFANSTPADYSYLMTGLYVSIPIAMGLAAMSLWLHFRPLNRSELTVIYACVLIAIPWCICIKAVIESSTANLFELQRTSEPELYNWARNMPWWGPTVATGEGPASPEMLSAVKGFTRGNGGNVPWSLWWRPVAYWVGLCLAFEGMLMGLLLMFRKRWIEHERLPFVWSYPALDIIGQQDQQRRNWRRWILFAIGLAVCLPGIVMVGPNGAPTTGWSVPPWAGVQAMEGIRSGVDLTSLNILPNMQLRLFWGPLVLMLLVLFPVDVLLTVAITFVLISLVLPQALASLGISSGPWAVNAFVKYSLRFGGGIGLLVWSLWFSRKTIGGYVRSLWGRKPADPESDDELGRRKIILITILGVAAFIFLGMFACRSTISDPSIPWYYSFTSPLVQMIAVTLLILIYAFSQARLRVEGLPISYDSNIGSHQLGGIQREIMHDSFTLAGKGVPVTGTSWVVHWFQYGFIGQLKSLGPHNMLLEAFKVGYEFKVNARLIAKAILIAMLIVAAVTPLLYIKLMYMYGFENSYQGGLNNWESFTQWSERAASMGLHSGSVEFVRQPVVGGGWASFYGQYCHFFEAFYGFVFVGILFYLRREFPRFPISPIGVVMAADQFPPIGNMPFSPLYIWFSFLIAGIFKLLVFRWMGIRSFREKIQPAVIMILCGMIYGLLLFLFREASLSTGVLK